MEKLSLTKKVEFNALIKDAGRKALVSGDSSYNIVIRGEDCRMAQLIEAPSDKYVKICVEWEND